MPARSAAEKAERKLRQEEKREARKLAKEQKKDPKNLTSGTPDNESSGGAATNVITTGAKQESLLLRLPDVAMHSILCCLPSRDVGCLTMTCRLFNEVLGECRVPYLMSRIHRPKQPLKGGVGFIDLCSDEGEARLILKQSYGGGDTGRLVPKGKKCKDYVTEFVSYARFLEESVCGYCPQSCGRRKSPTLLPAVVNGRFISASPEHSLCRVGGGGNNSGAGGSGVAVWGVGKRGQLGLGKRLDEPKPKMLFGGIGYGIRIVQVSAGGGLVRVAHSLLLTSTGRVLSFGTGSYGALGHGYSSGKQLPDVLRPKYIDALASVRCVCVSAGELHSAVVTSDGDVYTFGDGFCGQLGHADKRPQVEPKQVTTGGLEDECVASISCGARHTVAITEDGEAFSWGLGHFGVLGRSFTPFDHDPDAAVVNWQGPARVEDGPVAAAAAALPSDGIVEPFRSARQIDEDNESGVRDLLNPDHPNVEPSVQADLDDGQVNFAAELMEHLNHIANLSLTDSSDQCIPKLMDSMKGVNIVGASAGHRHTLLLDEHGGLYSCGTGCLGHGDTQTQMYPMKIKAFDDDNIRIMKMSAGVDISMAVSTTGDVYGWGKRDRGRNGLGLDPGFVMLPRKITLAAPAKDNTSNSQPTKAIDVDCGYVHSLVLGLDGTVHQCGGVGVNGENDGVGDISGYPDQINDFNIWHRIPEPKEQVKVQQEYKKYGKYEIKGKRKMMTETYDHVIK